jgi:uncharacterized membrane protein YfcA
MSAQIPPVARRPSSFGVAMKERSKITYWDRIVTLNWRLMRIWIFCIIVGTMLTYIKYIGPAWLLRAVLISSAILIAISPFIIADHVRNKWRNWK